MRRYTATRTAPLQAEGKGEQRSSRQGRNRAHVIPVRPRREVAAPQVGANGAVRRNGCQRVVQRHIEKHRHQEGADEIKQRAGKQEHGAGLLPGDQRHSNEKRAQRRRSHERAEEQRVDDHDIDGLHRGDAMRGRKTSERAHDEGREGKEYAADEAGPERRYERQREKQVVEHLKASIA